MFCRCVRWLWLGWAARGPWPIPPTPRRRAVRSILELIQVVMMCVHVYAGFWQFTVCCIHTVIVPVYHYGLQSCPCRGPLTRRMYFSLRSCKTENCVMATAAAPASKVEAPTNMAAAKIAAVDFNKMTSKWHHSTSILAVMFVGEDLLANRWLKTLLMLWLDVRSLENI